MDKLNPLKRFGQNYLIDKNIIRKIISEFHPEKEDNIIEIGPGKGALTEELSKNVDNLTAFEIDKRVVDNLRFNFPQYKILNKDFLDADLKSIFKNGRKLRIIGNIPFNITSSILFLLIKNRELIEDAVLMVQNEVAKRITAKPNSKEYGILSVLLNYFSKPKYCFKISPNVFIPKPKVHSAIIHIYFNKKRDPEIDETLFINLVKASFNNRRKTLKNSLSNSIFKTYNLSKIEFDFSKRAESLTIDDFVFLTREIKQLEISNNKFLNE